MVDKSKFHETISPSEAGETVFNVQAKAWSYIRLSDPTQIEGHGEARQLDAAASYAEEHGLNLQPPLRDLGVSAFKGRHRKKGNLGKFLALMQAGLVPRGSYFLVENCDRLSREDPFTAFETFSTIINGGVNVVTTDDKQLYNREVLARDPMRLVFWIMQSIRGNSESKRKSEMVTKAARARLKVNREAGKALSGRVPTWLRKKADGQGYEVDPAKGPVIWRIFREIDAGLGGMRIAQRLNADGIPPFNDYRNKPTRGWHNSVVTGIAKNRAVLGEHQMTRLEGEGESQRRVPDGDPIPNYYPAVITDEALWHRVQKRIRERSETRHNGGGRKGEEFSNLLNGIAVCANCGGPMLFRGAYGKTRAVLQCGNAARKHTCTSKKRFDYDRLEGAILRFVAEVDLVGPEGRSEAEIELDLLQGRRDDITRKLTNLLDTLEDDPDPDIRERVRQRRTEIDAINNQIGALRLRMKETAAAMRPRDHQEAVQRLMAELATKSGEDRYALRARLSVALAAVIDRVVFYGQPDVKTRGGTTISEHGCVLRMVGDERSYLVTDDAVHVIEHGAERSAETIRLIA